MFLIKKMFLIKMLVCLESCKTKFYFNAALSQMCGRQAVVTQSFVSDTCVDLYFALFFTASGWLAARSLTSLSATAQSVCYHLLNDTFCLWWVWFLYWNQYAQRFVSLYYFYTFRQDRRWRSDESLVLFSFLSEQINTTYVRAVWEVRCGSLSP